eukprot:COSAG01_NODE_3598_length_5891_cov_36.754662_8_plen_93_part_00
MYASLMRGDWKLMIGQAKDNYSAHLFDLRHDVGEEHDLAETPAGRAKVSQSGELLSRRGRSSSAHASGLDAHRDSISRRVGCRRCGSCTAPS